VTTLIVGENIFVARDAMQRIVLERALRPGVQPRWVYGRIRGIDRGMLGNEDFIVLDARRPYLLLQADLNAVSAVVVEGRMPLVMRWLIAGLKFNNGIPA
jgi:hypothetical protein